MVKPGVPAEPSRGPVWLLVPVPVPSGSAAAALLEAEEHWRDRLTQLEASERRLRRLTAVATKMAARSAKLQVEKERQRLARELHTGVGQLLAAVKIQVELIDQYLPERPETVSKALESIGALAADALEQVRAVSHELYVPMWQRIPLPQAIESLWKRSGMAQRFRGVLRLSPLTFAPDGATKALVYRALQEAISNVMRHSRATQVAVSLEEEGGKLVLTVEDNGVGFHGAENEQASKGMGLRALRDEATALGAELAVDSGAGGTKLKLSVPIA